MTLAVASASGFSAVAGVARDPNVVLLPGLQLPFGTPAFLRDSHTLDMLPVYGDVKMQSGVARRRRVYRSAPQTTKVSLELNLAQASAFHDWFEANAKGGEEFFSAQVAQPAPGLLWYKARFMSPYKTSYLGGQFWRVEAELMLFGLGSYSQPESVALTGGVTFDLLGRAVVLATNPISGGVLFNLVLNPALTQLVGAVTFELLNATYRNPPSVAVASGVGTATSVSQTNVIAGFANSFAGVNGVGSALLLSAGFAAGSSIAAASSATAASVGNAAGVGSATAQVLINYVASAAGTSAVAAASATVTVGIASAFSLGYAAASSVAAAVGIGSAAGVGTATGIRALSQALASGAGTATAVSAVLVKATASAAGVGTATTAVPAAVWTARTLGTATGAGNTLSGVAWNGAKFLAVSNNVFYTSTTGTSWATNTPPITSGWTTPAWNGTVWCVTGGGTVKALTSTDGVTWTQNTLPTTSGSWMSVVWDGTKFVAISSNGDTASSSTGTTWALATAISGFSANTPHPLSANPSTGVIVAVNGNSGNVYTSTNSGASWTTTALPALFFLYHYAAIVWTGNVFAVAINGTGTDGASTSPNGTTWTLRAVSSGSYFPIGASGTRIFLPLTSSGSSIQTSGDDGATWTSETLPASGNWGEITGNNAIVVLFASDANTTSYMTRA